MEKEKQSQHEEEIRKNLGVGIEAEGAMIASMIDAMTPVIMMRLQRFLRTRLK